MSPEIIVIILVASCMILLLLLEIAKTIYRTRESDRKMQSQLQSLGIFISNTLQQPLTTFSKPAAAYTNGSQKSNGLSIFYPKLGKNNGFNELKVQGSGSGQIMYGQNPSGAKDPCNKALKTLFGGLLGAIAGHKALLSNKDKNISGNVLPGHNQDMSPQYDQSNADHETLQNDDHSNQSLSRKNSTSSSRKSSGSDTSKGSNDSSTKSSIVSNQSGENESFYNEESAEHSSNEANNQEYFHEYENPFSDSYAHCGNENLNDEEYDGNNDNDYGAEEQGYENDEDLNGD